MGHGPARHRDWSYLLVGRIYGWYMLVVHVGGTCSWYLLVVPVGRICLGTRADFSGDHPHSGRYRADSIPLGQFLLG